MLVSPAQLTDHLSDRMWVIFARRHDLMDHAKGARHYQEGHPPGAFLLRSKQSCPVLKNRHQRPPPVAHGVARPNIASVALHEKLGFQKVAQFGTVGWKFGRWIDVGHWELIL